MPPALALPAGVFDVLDAALARDPDAPALVTRSASLTYVQFDNLAARAAGALFALGIRPGDRVAAALPNDVDIILAFHGAMRLGAIWVGINRALAPPEKVYLLENSGAGTLLGDESVVEELAGRAAPGVHLAAPGDWQAALAASDGRPQLPQPDPDAPAAIAYTSGTTGFPKGAVHCQAALVQPGAATVARRGWGPTLRKGDSLALTILNMHTLTTLLTAQAGGTAIIIDQGDVATIVAWIRRERITVWNGPPAQLHTMVRDSTITPADLASLNEVWVGGGDCPDRLREAFESRFGVRVSRSYGLTEAPALVSIEDLTGARSPGTSGRPLDHINVQSVEGELVLSPTSHGPWANRYRPLLGYWNQPEATAAVLNDRVLRTGDLGKVEPDGQLRLVGRKSQVIIRGGANVYPAEVERVLVEAPGVGACAVIGVPDERLGERVAAAVEPRPGENVDKAAVMAFCRQALAGYKVPERLVVVERLPRNQMGKVPRTELLRLLAGSGPDSTGRI
jgi:acyl-CoA synthetase (AMP-forming)/AMP-acid ligase II